MVALEWVAGQGLMRPHPVIEREESRQPMIEGDDAPRHRPSSSMQCGDELSEGQVTALDERGLNPTGKSACLKGVSDLSTGAKDRSGEGVFQSSARANFDDLGIQQSG